VKIRAAVDVIAHVHLDGEARAAAREVCVDDPQHLFEQMRATMNVGHRVDPYPLRQFRLAFDGRDLCGDNIWRRELP
jgi:hypothetical protein